MGVLIFSLIFLSLFSYGFPPSRMSQNSYHPGRHPREGGDPSRSRLPLSQEWLRVRMVRGLSPFQHPRSRECAVRSGSPSSRGWRVVGIFDHTISHSALCRERKLPRRHADTENRKKLFLCVCVTLWLKLSWQRVTNHRHEHLCALWFKFKYLNLYRSLCLRDF